MQIMETEDPELDENENVSEQIEITSSNESVT